jgi:hypothetical protein
VVFGDPTLCIHAPIQMKVTKPENGLYLNDKKILSFPISLAIGKISIEATAACADSPIEKVEFYVDNTLQGTDTTAPYSWVWKTPALFRHSIKVVAYDTTGRTTSRDVTLWKFF